MELNKNMGAFDRGLRVTAAVVFGYLYFSGTVVGTLGIVLLVLGVIFLVTSFISFCPLYLPFKVSTRKK
jgi:hypothetical protein